jgi:FG-GAP repeat/Viral BACON domain
MMERLLTEARAARLHGTHITKKGLRLVAISVLALGVVALISRPVKVSTDSLFGQPPRAASRAQISPASDSPPSDNSSPLPALQGDQAIERLKQQGLYESLRRIVAAKLTSSLGLTQQAKLGASDAASGDVFGYAVAINGDTAVVGAPFDAVGANTRQGSAYVFVRSGTVWTQQTKLTASDGATGASFGGSVAISGDTAILGATGDSTLAYQAGAAYVFIRTGTTWTQQAKITPSDPGGEGHFGISVAISGDTAVVGRVDRIPNAAYVFVRSGSTWSQQAKLTVSDGTSNSGFGGSVAISGDTVVGGAPYQDGANSQQGAAYVFVRSGTVWTQQQKLTVSDGATLDEFGYSVAISGETLVVGAPFDDVGENMDAGSAYIFVRSGTVWTQQQKLLISNGAANDAFGSSVGISGNTLAVGASGANTGQGSAYLFVRSGTVWIGQQNLTASDGAAHDRFGFSVGLSGETVVVGAYQAATPAGTAAGAAYVFACSSAAIWTQQVKVTASDAGPSDDFGFSVAINGDTAIVGAVWDDTSAGSMAGSAYVFVKSGAGWTEQAKLTASDAAAFDEFGHAVAISGDTAVVGAFVDDTSAGMDAGSAYVFVRSGTSWTQQAKLTASDAMAGDQFGWSVAISGATILVGVPSHATPAGALAGSAYVFVRSGVTWSEQAKLTASDAAFADFFGQSVAISGDTVIVGAEEDDTNAGEDAGSAYVFVRSGTTWTQQAKLTASDAAAGDHFGNSVGISGETVLVGARSDQTSAGTNAGSAYVFVRSGSIWSQQAKLTASDAVAGDQFGWSVAISGEIAVVGTLFGNSETASAYAFVRSGSSWTQQAWLIASDAASGDGFGQSVAISGKTAVIGAPNDDTPAATNAGSAYFFDGSCLCDYSIAPLSQAFAGNGGSGSVNVVAASGCNWTATSNASWITVTAGSSGSGNGTVNYSVDQNINVTPRTGALTIAGLSFTVTQAGLPAVGLAYHKTDFDSDNKSDLGYYRSGLWGFLKSAQSYSTGNPLFFSWGAANQQPICADFDGDGKADIGYMVPPSGGQSAAYAILLSSRNYSFATGQPLFVPAGFPSIGDTPVVGDYDGDGKADPGIWRATQGVWIIPKSSSNYMQYVFAQWGQLGDVPVIADFDHDGKADIGFYRNGLWGILKSSANYSTNSPIFFSWGGAGLQPIVGDFDGDGQADIGYMVPPSSGQSAAYAILLSSRNYSFAAGQPLFVSAGFPSIGDTPVVGDFDGDGKADPGIWRESQGVWIVPLSGSNYTTYIFSQWGGPGDIAFPNSTGRH